MAYVNPYSKDAARQRKLAQRMKSFGDGAWSSLYSDKMTAAKADEMVAEMEKFAKELRTLAA
jgi:hypothetical protein